jgi:hypothetical protein
MKEKMKMVLLPCQRDGNDDDWWDEQHTCCTGSHHLSPTEEIICSCPCHKVEVTDDGLIAVPAVSHTTSVNGEWAARPC